MNTSMEDFTNMLNIQEEEINNTVANTAEWLTFESTRALNEVMEEVDKAIEKAIKGKKYEAQVMLMDYKQRVGGYGNESKNEDRFKL